MGAWDPAKVTTSCCMRPRLNSILEGTYTVRSDGVVQVLRQGSEAWEEVAPGSEVVLTTGDALFSRMADCFEAANTSPNPVEILDGVLFEGYSLSDPIPAERSGRPA